MHRRRSDKDMQLTKEGWAASLRAKACAGTGSLAAPALTPYHGEQPSSSVSTSESEVSYACSAGAATSCSGRADPFSGLHAVAHKNMTCMSSWSTRGLP